MAKMQIKRYFENRRIEPISSPYGFPILFVKKRDEALQMVIKIVHSIKKIVKMIFIASC